MQSDQTPEYVEGLGGSTLVRFVSNGRSRAQKPRDGVNAYLTWNDLSCLKRRVMVVFLKSVSQLTSSVEHTVLPVPPRQPLDCSVVHARHHPRQDALLNSASDRPHPTHTPALSLLGRQPLHFAAPSSNASLSSLSPPRLPSLPHLCFICACGCERASLLAALRRRASSPSCLPSSRHPRHPPSPPPPRLPPSRYWPSPC